MYGSVIGLILENISGFETVDSQILTQTINEIRRLGIRDFLELHEYRYEAEPLINRGLRNRVNYARKSRSKDSTMDWKIIY